MESKIKHEAMDLAGELAMPTKHSDLSKLLREKSQACIGELRKLIEDAAIEIDVLSTVRATPSGADKATDECDRLVIQFALRRFISQAYTLANEAAQDKAGRHHKKGAFEAFMRDANDAERILANMRTAVATGAPVAAQDWISVADRLPEPYREVHAKHADGSFRIARRSKKSGGCWQLACFGEGEKSLWPDNDVTHWCILAASESVLPTPPAALQGAEDAKGELA